MFHAFIICKSLSSSHQQIKRHCFEEFIKNNFRRRNGLSHVFGSINCLAQPGLKPIFKKGIGNAKFVKMRRIFSRNLFRRKRSKLEAFFSAPQKCFISGTISRSKHLRSVSLSIYAQTLVSYISRVFSEEKNLLRLLEYSTLDRSKESESKLFSQ